MSTLNDDDIFLYQDTDGNTGRVANSNRSLLNDDDVFLVQREGTTYRVKASDVGTGGGGSDGIPAREATTGVTYDNATPVNLDRNEDQSIGQDRALYFAYSDYSVNAVYIRWLSGQSMIEVRGYKSTNDINDYDYLYNGKGNFTLDEHLNYQAIRIWATSDAVFSFKHDDVSMFPAKPSIQSPVEGSTLETSAVTFQSSNAVLTSGQTGSWSTARWQLATSPDFVSGFQEQTSTLTGNNPEQGPSSFSLTTSTNYYTRTKYSTTDSKLSPWSDVRSFATSAAKPITVQLLLVGGGGGAGGELGGGGGGGGFRLWSPGTGNPLDILSDTEYFVQVGAGGGAINTLTAGIGSQGVNTHFGDLIAAGGGGGGGYQNNTAGNGGSGGGQGNTFPGGSGNFPSTTPPQGTDGGGARNYGGGGGGGASVKGQDGPGSAEINQFPYLGNGGNGADTNIRGYIETFAGGGGGGGATGRSAGGAGGSGGGGTGGGGTDSGKGGNGTDGAATSGGGGGGSAWSAGSVVAGNGGSGIVIVRYPSNFTLSIPGGGLSVSYSNVGGDTVATFTGGVGNIIFR